MLPLAMVWVSVSTLWPPPWGCQFDTAKPSAVQPCPNHGLPFLLHLSFKLIRSFSTDQEIVADAMTMSSHWHAIRDGFLIAVINPKILIFFTALFSQFVRVDSGIGEKLGLALVAGVVDILWYLCVATVVVSSISTRRFIGGGRWMDLLFGLILAAVALRFLVQIGSSYFHW